jgi:hypothetical protein
VEDGVRFCVDRFLLDQNNAGQLADAAHVLFDYRLTGRRLLGGEAKNASWIATDYEPHPGVAQIADSIEQDERRSHPGYHRVPPFTNKARLKRESASFRPSSNMFRATPRLLEAKHKTNIRKDDQQPNGRAGHKI